MAYKRLSTSLGSKTLNNTSSLGLGGNQNLRPSCRRPPTRTFHTPVGTLRLDAPALVTGQLVALVISSPRTAGQLVAKTRRQNEKVISTDHTKHQM